MTDLGVFFGKSIETDYKEDAVMRKKGFKGRCEKRALSKCADVCRTSVILFVR